MKKKYIKAGFILNASALLMFLSTSNAISQVVQTFSNTGSVQTFVVPACVSSISLDVRGGQGANALDKLTTNSSGGLGGRAMGVMSVTTGQTLYIYVGGVGNTNGNGGFNGGGAGGISTAGGSCFGGPAGGGGGASDIRVGGIALSNRVIVAGGGGGSGRDYCNGSCQPCGCGGSGGGGGGLTGVVGQAANNCGFSYPGTNVNGGPGGTQLAGGLGAPADGSGNAGTAGGLGIGGNGGAGTLDVAGGGGGGGYYGGGGGGSAASGSGVGGGGGGGGSSYFSGLTSTSTTQSFQSGDGLVTLTYVYAGAITGAAATPSVICLGGTATLAANSQVTYTWSPGGSSSSSIVITPTANTTYTVQGTNSFNCVSTAVITLTVDPAIPSLTVANTASATGGICPTQTVALTAFGATTYSWTGGVSNGVSFAPPSSGTYVVTGGNACGTSSAAASISVHLLPTVSGIASTPTICSGNPVSLTGVGNAVTYTWTGGILNGINFFPSTTGSYTVTGTSAQSCTNTAVSTITVVTTPVAQPFATPPLICIGSSSSLTAAGATTYTWITPTGVFNTTGINVTPTVTTTYTVTKANANCANTQTVNVIVNMLPNIFAIVTPTLICANKPATLTAAGAATYTWAAAGPPVFTVTGANPVVSPGVSTMYTITASDGTCVNTGAVFLAVNPNPTLSIVPSSSVICRGQSATLTASGALSFTWTTPTATIANASIVESPTTTVLYNVVGTNTFNCTSGASQVVVVNPTPTLQVYSNKPLVCIGAPASLTVSGANTYQWDANANNATTPVTQVNPNSTTIYSVTGFITATGCNSTKTIQINVFSPTFAVNNPTSSCLGGTINLIATGAISYTWNGNQPFQMISVSPPTATVYVVSATSQSNGVNCISSNSVGVSIYANPTITAVSQRTLICKGEYGNLVASGAQTYEWSTSQTGSVVPVNPTAAQNIYTVTGTDQNGCVGTATVMQKVSTCFGINEQSAVQLGLSIFPNPNNGTFTIKSTVDLTLSLVNELGQVVESMVLSNLNDHQHKLENLSSGIYFLKGGHASVIINEKIVVLK